MNLNKYITKEETTVVSLNMEDRIKAREAALEIAANMESSMRDREFNIQIKDLRHNVEQQISKVEAEVALASKADTTGFNQESLDLANASIKDGVLSPETVAIAQESLNNLYNITGIERMKESFNTEDITKDPILVHTHNLEGLKDIGIKLASASEATGKKLLKTGESLLDKVKYLFKDNNEKLEYLLGKLKNSETPKEVDINTIKGLFTSPVERTALHLFSVYGDKTTEKLNNLIFDNIKHVSKFKDVYKEEFGSANDGKVPDDIFKVNPEVGKMAKELTEIDKDLVNDLKMVKQKYDKDATSLEILALTPALAGNNSKYSFFIDALAKPNNMSLSKFVNGDIKDSFVINTETLIKVIENYLKFTKTAMTGYSSLKKDMNMLLNYIFNEGKYHNINGSKAKKNLYDILVARADAAYYTVSYLNLSMIESLIKISNAILKVK